MIRYALACEDGHAFDSWFQSAEAYDRLRAAGHVACSFCGSTRVSKALMAPAVQPARRRAAPPSAVSPTVAPAPALPAPGPSARPTGPTRAEIEARLAELRRQVEENSEYVGMSFAAEARAIHDGTAPERAIYGEARLDQAKALIEDGIPVAPLPFLPSRKRN